MRHTATAMTGKWAIGFAVNVSCALTLGAQELSNFPDEHDLPRAGFMSRARAVAAMDSVFTWIERRHPAPYQHRSRLSVERERRGVARAMPDSVDRWWMANQLASMVASLKDESMRVNNYSVVAANEANATSGAPVLFPADIDWVEDAPVVVSGRQGLWKGDRLISVNGLSVDSLIRDASNVFAGTAAARLQAAAQMFSMHVAQRALTTSPFHVVLERVSGERVSLTVDTRGSAGGGYSVSESLRADTPDADEPLMRMLRGRALVVDVGLLSLYESTYPALFKKIAQRVQRDSVRALIVEMRWHSHFPSSFAPQFLAALARNSVIGRTGVPVCALIGPGTGGRATTLASALRRRHLARTIGQDAGTHAGSLPRDLGRLIPDLAATLMLPDTPYRRHRGAPAVVHPMIHQYTRRSDVAFERDGAMELAINCGALPAPR